MIWIGLAFVVIVVMIIRVIKRRGEHLGNFIGWTIVTLLLTPVFIFLTAPFIEPFVEKEIELQFEKPIYAIEDNSSIEGHCGRSITYVRTGYTNEVEYYHYISNGTYGKKTEKVPVSETYLIETDTNFRIEVYEKKFKNEWIKIFTFFDFVGYGSSRRIYKIYVPYGTITTDYNIDLQY